MKTIARIQILTETEAEYNLLFDLAELARDSVDESSEEAALFAEIAYLMDDGVPPTLNKEQAEQLLLVMADLDASSVLEAGEMQAFRSLKDTLTAFVREAERDYKAASQRNRRIENSNQKQLR